jgi:hypothetical protein
MVPWRWTARLAALALTVVLAAGAAHASRVPSSRTISSRNFGSRPDGMVPYTTNGFSTLGVYQGVAPRVYASPNVNTPGPVQIQPVFNLPFYGGVRAFGTWSDGATARPPVQIRRD